MTNKDDLALLVMNETIRDYLHDLFRERQKQIHASLALVQMIRSKGVPADVLDMRSLWSGLEKLEANLTDSVNLDQSFLDFLDHDYSS